MTEGQDQIAQQKAADGLKLLRAAYELDENNSLGARGPRQRFGGAGSFHCRNRLAGGRKNLPRRRSI